MSRTNPTADAAAPVGFSTLVTRRRLYRTAGIGGIAVLLFWVLQPIIVFVIIGDRVSQPTWQYFHDYRFNGIYEAITFCGVGFGILTFVLALDRLVHLGSREVSVWWRLGTVCGLVAGTTWLLTAGITLVPFTSVGDGVNRVVPALADQNVVFEAWAVMVTGMLMAYALTSAAWLTIFGVIGRRRGVIGWPSACLAFAGAALTVLPVLIPFSPPIGGMTGLACLFVLGIVFFVKSRKA
ncbi:hypothetical protein ACPPVQ_05865 [Diaminobutyricibacter sp. McL0618]|uniref:hypothetical protein n=1 Tax=Leifsonia sp. McL0618 TaxID=3415677 RepID=UPI003CF06457